MTSGPLSHALAFKFSYAWYDPLGPNHTQYKISLTFSYKNDVRKRPSTRLRTFRFHINRQATVQQSQTRTNVEYRSWTTTKRHFLHPLGVSYKTYAVWKFSWKLSWRLPWHRTKTWFYIECGLALRGANFVCTTAYSYRPHSKKWCNKHQYSFATGTWLVGSSSPHTCVSTDDRLFFLRELPLAIFPLWL